MVMGGWWWPCKWWFDGGVRGTVYVVAIGMVMVIVVVVNWFIVNDKRYSFLQMAENGHD